MLSEEMVIEPDRYEGSGCWRRFPGLNPGPLVWPVDPGGEAEGL